MLHVTRTVVLSIALYGAAVIETWAHAAAQSNVVAWGDNGYGQCNVPALTSGLAYVEVAAGENHVIARLSDGSAVAWGNNSFGQCNVPALPSGLTYVEVAAGTSHSVARLSDGSVVAWGDNFFGQCNVPPLPSGLTFLEVAAGETHTVARVSDGSAVAWGDNHFGECNVPALPGGLTYVDLAAGGGHTVARRSDGSVLGWGRNLEAQCDVPALPSGVTYVDVLAGWHFTIFRRSDGAVVARGDNSHGQCNVPALPNGLTYVEVAAGYSHAAARLSDGSVVAWGRDATVPALSGLTCKEIAAGARHTVARLADADCNHNGVRDDLDIQSGGSADCNANGIPDECDLLQGASADCDGNGVLDSCEMSSNPSLDLNHDRSLDACPLNCQRFWQAYIGGNAGMDGAVAAMIVYDDGTGPALYVGGAFQNSGGVPANSIAKWDGATWSAPGGGVSGGDVSAFAIYDDGGGSALFVGGTFSSAGGVAVGGLAKWDGHSWSSLGSSSTFSASALAVFDDGAGPQLYWPGQGPGLVRWNGSTLSAVRYDHAAFLTGTAALLVHDDGTGAALYVGGRDAGHSVVARWDGSSWARLPGIGAIQILSLARHIDATGAHMFAGTSTLSSQGGVDRWDGLGWTQVGTLCHGPSYNYVRAYALCSYDDGTGPALYVGGQFDSVNGVPATNIAKWDGNGWSGLAAGANGSVHALCPYDDGSGPKLLAGGSFTTVDLAPANNFASWGLPDGCVPAGTATCGPGVNGVIACPCSNPPLGLGRGCNNSSGTGGASLTTTGFARLGTDNLVLTTGFEKPGALSLVLQGTVSNQAGASFGQGVRCVAGALKRLYAKAAIGGTISAPGPGNPSITTRSAALGDTIAQGTHRYYGVYYRDPVILGGCPAGTGFNMTQQVDVLWHP